MSGYQTNRLLLCEGKEDEAFALELMRLELIPKMDTDFIGKSGHGHGIDGLAKHLEGLPGIPRFGNIEHLTILADCEDARDTTFRKIQEAFAKANKSIGNTFSLPEAENVVAPGKPTTLIVLQPPAQESGCLETALLRFLSRKHPIEMECVETFLGCSGGLAGWTDAKRDKVRLRAAIGVLYKENPSCSVSYLWNRQRDSNGQYIPIAMNEQLVPLDEPEFTEIARLLSA